MKITVIATGSIAVVKTYRVLSFLRDVTDEVNLVLTKNALQFVNKALFIPFVDNIYTDEDFFSKTGVLHIDLANSDCLIVYPATLNIISKMANGIADDLASTILAASLSRNNLKVIFPAMNKFMYDSPILQENMNKLKEFGVEFIEPVVGKLACGDIGKGKIIAPQEAFEFIKFYLKLANIDLSNKKIIVTGGATKTFLDDIRFLTNKSTGKMAYLISLALKAAKADVLLITAGKVSNIVRTIKVETSKEMLNAILENIEGTDVFISNAAVNDFKFEKRRGKIKKEGKRKLTLKLEKDIDILATISEKYPNILKVGFAAEEKDNLDKNAISKLKRKKLDLIVANALSSFASDNTSGKIFFKSGEFVNFNCTKEELAIEIVKVLNKLFN